MRTREKLGLALLASAFVGIGAWACNSDPDFGKQPFINDVPSSTVTNPPAPPPDPDTGTIGADARVYDTDAAYALGLCKDTCSCDLGSGQYCVGQYTNLTFDQCDIPDAGDGGPPPTFRIGCNYVPQACANMDNPCPCIIGTLGALPCLPECVKDSMTGQITLFCPNP